SHLDQSPEPQSLVVDMRISPQNDFKTTVGSMFVLSHLDQSPEPQSLVVDMRISPQNDFKTTVGSMFV
ncbi:hypothetical protein WCN72_14305, partial [Staphylococcus aureus]|uniref:hypothetical protein n=1 Tax=Staphylococcus aureus TaxID=1280 RepID=UPI003D17582D